LDDVVRLTIDGEEIEVRKGATVLEAAEEAGFFIPTLCSDADLAPYGACRLCVVEIAGVRGLPTACTTLATDGMVVRTDSPEIGRVRRTAIQLIRSNHPTDCDACPRNQQCDLQMTESILDATKARFQAIPKDMPVDKSNPFFTMDRNYCVLCAKCVRACDEIRGVEAINLSSRGFKTKVSAGADGLLIDSTCESCGECLDHCPVYAINPKETRKPSKEIETTCGYCGVGCGVTLGVRQDAVVSSRGRKEGTVNRGSLCVKGRFGISEFVHHRDRLTAPLVRKNGELVKASWDEALDLVARKLTGYPGNELAVIASPKCTNEDTYLAQKFARAALGTNNIDNQGRLGLSPSMAGLTRAFGSGAMTNSIEELSDSACILAVGIDLAVTHPIIALKVKRAVRKGAKLIVFNSRETDLVRFASSVLKPKPGTDVALLMGMLRTIVDEGLFDPAFVAERCQGFNSLKESLKAFPLNIAEQISGVPADRIAAAARVYAANGPAAIVYGGEFALGSQGTDHISALANLALLTGNIGKPSSGISPLFAQNNAQGACDMGAMPDSLPGYQGLADPSARTKFETAWGCSIDPSPGLTFDGICAAAARKQVKAVYMIGANPVLGEPDRERVRESLAALEFLVVQDVFLTETARMAHVVLPAATFAEKDGTFTNTERRIQRVRKAIDPVGDAKPDWWITSQLGQRTGKKGFSFENPSKIMQEIAALTPVYGGVSYERLEESGLHWPCPDKQSEGTPVLHTGPLAAVEGQFVAVNYQASRDLTDAAYPLMLTLGRSLYYSQTGTLARKSAGLATLRGQDTLEINPDDALALQIKEGEMVTVVSPRGQMPARARLSKSTSRGNVFMVFPFVDGQTGLLNTPVPDPEFPLSRGTPYAVRIEKRAP
jgi:formate dehydrogenase alpha subunit